LGCRLLDSDESAEDEEEADGASGEDMSEHATEEDGAAIKTPQKEAKAAAKAANKPAKPR
jgi:hypothetical protein